MTTPGPAAPDGWSTTATSAPRNSAAIYEGLLEYVPRYDVAQRDLRPSSRCAGNERKNTGAYYTPASLTECLSTRPSTRSSTGPNGRRILRRPCLSLTVCDPACGSGHFLVAAGRRIAAPAGHRPSRWRRTDRRRAVMTAMHDVVARCLYGVDLNPMAAELAKVSLWLEGMQPGRPLALLDGHIKVGNSLLGTTPALLADGIPDDAFTPIEGDDQDRRGLKKRNKAEQVGPRPCSARAASPCQTVPWQPRSPPSTPSRRQAGRRPHCRPAPS